MTEEHPPAPTENQTISPNDVMREDIRRSLDTWASSAGTIANTLAQIAGAVTKTYGQLRFLYDLYGHPYGHSDKGFQRWLDEIDREGDDRKEMHTALIDANRLAKVLRQAQEDNLTYGEIRAKLRDTR